MIPWLKKSKQKRRGLKKNSRSKASAPVRSGNEPRLSSKSEHTTKIHTSKPAVSSRPVSNQQPPRVRYTSGTNPPMRKSSGAGKKRRKSSSSLPPWYTRRALWASAISAGIMCLIIAGITVAIVASSLPTIDALSVAKKQHGIRVETEDGALIATYGEVSGENLRYDMIPPSLIQAVVATEDRRFFSHGGIDIWGITRAMLSNIWQRKLAQGGSTITQQLAKNLFLTPERTLKRKLQEVILAFRLESRYSKKQLLEIYLNRVYFGAGSFGIDAAARRYFGKSAHDINLVQSAMIAGLLKAPSRYAPTSNAQRARDRAHQVLINMEDAGYLSEAQVTQALADFAQSLPQHTVDGSSSRYFTDWVVDSIPEYLGHLDTDLVVITTLNVDNQMMADDALTTVMSTEGPAKNASQSALVSLSPDGAVRAMVGGINYNNSQFNRAVQAKRQAGSVFKLFVYLSALEHGYTPQTIVNDAPISMQVGNKIWTPENYSDGFKGEIPLAQALRESLNTVAVRLTQSVGASRVASMAERLGIANIPARPSLALGAVDVSLLDLVGAYATLPHNGNAVKPYGIVRITTTDHKLLYEHKKTELTPVLSESVVKMMNYMLRDVTRRGTGVKAFLPERDTAGKTGTSQNFKDAWFIGFTPQLSTGVWVGNDNNKPMNKVTGGSIPAMIWKSYMSAAMKGLPAIPIPASATDTSGILPWLGLGSNDLVPEQNSASQLPSDLPFGFANPTTSTPSQPAGIIAPVPVPTPVTATVTAPEPAPAPTPTIEIVDDPTSSTSVAPVITNDAKKNNGAESTGEVLDKKFWNQLLNEAKEPKLEYDYPNSR